MNLKFAAHIHAASQKKTLDIIRNALTKANQPVCFFFSALSYIQGLDL